MPSAQLNNRVLTNSIIKALVLLLRINLERVAGFVNNNVCSTKALDRDWSVNDNVCSTRALEGGWFCEC